MQATTEDEDEDDLDYACASQSQSQEEFSTPEDDEIARYLARGVERGKPRAFWQEHEHEFPILARMARDILSIPASGAGVERLFNCARDICHCRRGQLKASTIRALMLHQFTTRFGVEQKGINVVNEYLSAAEAALIDQSRKPIPQIESVWPISDNEEEDEELGLEDAQGMDILCTHPHEPIKDPSEQISRPRKRSAEGPDYDDDDLPEVPVGERLQSRPGRIRKQPKQAVGFQIDTR